MLVGDAYAWMVRSFESVRVDGSRSADVTKAYSTCLSSNDEVSSFGSYGSSPFDYFPRTKLSAGERYITRRIKAACLWISERKLI